MSLVSHFSERSGMRSVIGCVVAISVLLVVGCSEKKAPPAPPVAVKGDMELLVEQGMKDLKDAETWFHIADRYEMARQYPQQLDALQKVIAAKPEMGYAHLKLGNTYNSLGKREEAIKSLLEAKKHLPDNPVLYNNLGWTYGQVGKVKEQIAALRQAISLRPRYATGRLNLGLVLFRQGDRKGAEEQYTALLEFDEGTAQTLKKAIEGKKP
jgi:tetratricopeptide (TPR) repeat protein